MNRLTRRMCGGYGMVEGYELDTRRGAMAAIGRLAAYEDTGLEPEEVTAAKHALMGKTLAEIKEFEGIPLDRLRELAEAERNGRAVVLPCKPGEYWRDQNGDRVRIETVSFIHKEEFAVNWIYFRGHFTREEAETQEGGGACEK